ncbi:MAG: DUF1311 domain-containing protein [Carboxylicivirga sp.]|jgi:uncharacterized protein YecT (DUF1311 family)|nr:DUF1311 domain-containing protein [Carboxylicivirga sp.]
MKFTFTLLFILLPILGFAQTEKKETIDIDKELQACLDSAQNYTTAGMSKCIIKAADKWDKELNKQYKQLMSLLSNEAQTQLRDAQRQWIVFRDKEIELSHQIYTEMGGTMWIPVMYETRLNLTKQRTLELKQYVSNLTSAGL